MKTNWFLLASILAFGIMSILILKPFMGYLILAAILVFVSYPLYRKILSKLRSRSASALVLILLLILILLIPSFYLSSILFSEAKNIVQYIGSVDFSNLNSLESSINSAIGMNLNLVEIAKGLTDDLSRKSLSFIVSNIPFVTKIVANVFIGFVLMIFTMFYLYVDGENMANRIKELIPLGKLERERFLHKTYQITQGLFLGIFLVAILQGIVAGIGYLIFRVPNPIFWGVVTTFTALIPILGPPWIYVPLSIYLIVKGNMIAGIGLLVFGAIIISQIDNFFRPKFVRMSSGVSVHPLAIILGVIGGVAMFGMVGVIIGPLILSFFIELMKIYRKRK